MKLSQLLFIVATSCIGLAAQAQYEQIRTCSTLANRGNSSSAAQCNAAVAGKYLSRDADSVCNISAQNGYTISVVECIRNSVGGEFQQAGTEVCKELAVRGNSSSAAACMGLLRNKRVDQRVIGSCLQSARQGYTSSVNDCVRNSIIGDIGSQPRPNPGNGNSQRERDARILSLVKRTKEAVLSRDTQSAIQLLERVEQLVSPSSHNDYQLSPIVIR